jgi:16S rRNA processing protein RimM
MAVVIYAMTQTSPDLVFVAAIAGSHGVRGECRVKSFTGDGEAAFGYGAFLDDSGAPLLTPKRWRSAKDVWVVAFMESLTREQAQALKGTQLFVRRSALPELEDEEFYHADLIGLSVQGVDGSPMGRVKALHNFGSGDLLEIEQTPDQSGSWLLPFTQACVPHLSVAEGQVTIAPPDEIGGDDAEHKDPSKA